jgi:hypothetical protein
LLHQELKHVIAQFDFVRVVQFGPAANGNIIELRPVPASKVLEKIGAVVLQYLRVMPADGGVIQHHLAARMPAEDRTLPLQLDELARRGSLDDFQKRHNAPTRSGSRSIVPSLKILSAT